MMSRDELIFYAKERGHSVSDWQIERWHKKGIFPSPVRCPTEGKVGSAYLYPVGTEHNLELALTSKDHRNLDGMLLDVWLRAGKIDIDRLRTVLLRPVKVLESGVKNLEKLLNKLGREIRNPNERNTRQTLFPYVKPDDILATITVGLNMLSPKDEHRIWQPLGIEADNREKTAGEIADQVMGNDIIRRLDPDRRGETTEMAWDEMKELINVKKLRYALENATFEDFESIRNGVFIAEQVMDGLAELTRYSDSPLRMLRFWNNSIISSHIKRSLTITCMLTLYLNEVSHSWVLSAIDTWSKQLPRLLALKTYSEHMRMHPALKRRREWNQFLTTCDRDTLESLRDHHEAFMYSNPLLREQLLQ